MKKGFTLIELLAVIVILATIALIATPIVIEIINDSKESATLRSADFYIDALEQSIATATLNNKSIKAGTYPIMEDGNICLEEYDATTNECKDNDFKLDNNELKVEVKGEKPNSGTITITNGQVGDISLNLSDKVIVKNEKGELTFGKEKVTLVNYIKKLYSETKTTTVNNIEYSLDETHGLMNDRLGNKDVGKTEGNIRYYGANPSNYIDIGDRDSEGNIIFWRIIGLFKDVEVTDENDNVIKTEDLVKIIRADKLTSGNITGFSWDYNEVGEYDSNWSDSTLQIMLNDEVNGYYASGTTSYYNWIPAQDPTPTTLNFASTGLSSQVHSKIERVKWSLGGHHDYSVYADAIYGYERAGTGTWSGKIALMYPSDYGYSSDLSSCQTTLSGYENSNCKGTNWMYDSTESQSQWMLIPYSSNTNWVFCTYGSPGYVSYIYAFYAVGVRPVLYLKSDVSIVEEKETSEGLKYFVVE